MLLNGSSNPSIDELGESDSFTELTNSVPLPPILRTSQTAQIPQPSSMKKTSAPSLLRFSLCLGACTLFSPTLQAQELLVHYPFNDKDTATLLAADESVYHREGNFMNASGTAAALQTAVGVSGIPGDFAFDNSDKASGTTGMGNESVGGAVTANWEKEQKFDSLQSFTVTAWIRPKTTWTQMGTLLDVSSDFGNKTDPKTVLIIAARSVGAGRVVFSLGENQNAFDAVADFEKVGEWIFIAITYDSTETGNNVKLYAGTPDQEVHLAKEGILASGEWKALPKGKTVFALGNRRSLNRPFYGLIDDFRIYGDTVGGKGAMDEGEVEKIRKQALSAAAK